MKLFFLALGIGVLSGVVAALCGVGGGIVMVPAFVLLLGIDQKVAVATSLAVVIPTALAATSTNLKLVDWKLFAGAVGGAVLAAYLASGWMKEMRSETLTKIFAVVMIAVGVRMLFVKTAG